MSDSIAGAIYLCGCCGQRTGQDNWLMISQWQDIATAPRDGTPVDLWILHTPKSANYYDGRRTDCEFRSGEWVTWDNRLDEYCEVERLTPANDGSTYRATHWQPLPSPPKP